MVLTSINGGGIPLVTHDMVIDPIVGDAVSRSTLYARYGVFDPAFVPKPVAEVKMPTQPVTDDRIVSKYPVSAPVPYKPLIKPGAPPVNPTTAPSQAPTSFLIDTPTVTSQVDRATYLQQTVMDPLRIPPQRVTRAVLYQRYGVYDPSGLQTVNQPAVTPSVATTFPAYVPYQPTAAQRYANDTNFGLPPLVVSNAPQVPMPAATNTPINQQLVIAHQHYGYLIGPNLMVMVENRGANPLSGGPFPISYHSVVPFARLNGMPVGYTQSMSTEAGLQQMETEWLGANEIGPSNLPTGLVGSTMAPVGTQLATGTYPGLLTSFTSPAIPGQPTRANAMLAQAGGGTAILIVGAILFWFFGKGGK